MVRRVHFTEADANTHSSDVRAMGLAVLAVHSEWATLEDALAWTLSKTIGIGFGDNTGLAIYFTPVNAETRQALVNNIVLHRLSFRTVIPDDGIVSAWHCLMRKTDTARAFRNFVAHNHITEFDWRGKTHVRLTSSLFDPRKVEPGVSVAKPTGLTWRMVRAGARQIEWARKRILWFNELLQHIKRDAFELPPELYQQLIGDLGAEVQARDGRSSPKQATPRSPSPASPRKPKGQRKKERKAKIAARAKKDDG